MKVTILIRSRLSLPLRRAITSARFYHALGSGISATYVGTLHLAGSWVSLHLAFPGAAEIDIPLSEAHFRAADHARMLAGGRNVIDCLFHEQAHLSPDYVAQAKTSAAEADAVVFSHPWIYPLVRDVIDPSGSLSYTIAITWKAYYAPNCSMTVPVAPKWPAL